LYALPFYLLFLAIAVATGHETFFINSAFLGFVVLRSVSDIGAEWCKMTSLSHGDLSLVSGFYSLSPVFLLILSPLITGDPVTTQGALGVLIVGAGTLVMSYRKRGHHSKSSLKGIAFALVSSVFFAINSCFDRLAVHEASPLMSGFAMTALSALLLIPFAREPIRPAFRTAHKPFLIRGAIEAVFMFSKLSALQYISAPYVVAIMRVSVVFSVLSGHAFFKEEHFKQRLVGALLIVCGVAVIVLENF